MLSDGLALVWVVGLMVALATVGVLLLRLVAGVRLGAEGFASPTEAERSAMMPEEQVDVDELNHHRGTVRQAFMAALERFPGAEEQRTYVRLLVTRQTSFLDIVEQLKRSREYREKQRKEILDVVPPRLGQSMRETVGDDGDVREYADEVAYSRVLQHYGLRVGRLPSADEMRCAYDAVVTSSAAPSGEADVEAAVEGCASGGARGKETKGTKGGQGTKGTKGTKGGQEMRAKPGMPAMPAMPELEDEDGGREAGSGLEAREDEGRAQRVREVYADVRGRLGLGARELNERTLRMWAEELWREGDDVEELAARMERMYEAGSRLGGPSSGPVGAGEHRALAVVRPDPASRMHTAEWLRKRRRMTAAELGRARDQQYRELTEQQQQRT